MATKQAKREAALRCIDRFCEQEGFPVPPLDERRSGDTVTFIGKAPDGREFGIGYELGEPTAH